MDIKKITALLTVIRDGSLSAAADELGYSQPGLTNMMNSLEDELELKLLLRSKSGVRLSEDGQALLDKMMELHRVNEEFIESVSKLRERGRSTLHIGAIASAARNWMPEIVAEYKRMRPGLDIFVTRYENLTESYDAVRHGETDCAFVSYSDGITSDLEYIPLYDDEMIAIMPESYEGEGPVSPLIFDRKDFLMPIGGLDISILPFFEGGSSVPEFRRSNLDDQTIASMVAHGLGYSILSRLIMQGINEPVKMFSLSPPSFRQIGIICKADRKGDGSISELIKTARSLVGL